MCINEPTQSKKANNKLLNINSMILKTDLKGSYIYVRHAIYTSIHLSKNIRWSDNLLAEFGDKFDWSKWLITKDPLSTIHNVRRFKDKLDWGFLPLQVFNSPASPLPL